MFAEKDITKLLVRKQIYSLFLVEKTSVPVQATPRENISEYNIYWDNIDADPVYEFDIFNDYFVYSHSGEWIPACPNTYNRVYGIWSPIFEKHEALASLKYAKNHSPSNSLIVSYKNISDKKVMISIISVPSSFILTSNDTPDWFKT